MNNKDTNEWLDLRYEEVDINEMFKPNSKVKWYSRKVFLADDKDNPFILPEEHNAPYCLYNKNYKCEYLKYDGCCDKDCLFKK